MKEALLLLFLLLLPFSYACPELVAAVCRCSDLHNGVVLNCSDTNGAQIIGILKANQASLGLIQELTMQRAGLKKLPAGFFSGLYIKRLDLSYNKMVDLEDAAFVGIAPVLQELVLNHNSLTSVPSLQVATLKTLLRLDLSNNSIGDLQQEHALPNLPKLYDVNLANNKICQVHKAVFDNVRNSLQTINLGHNCLKAVPASALRGFKQLMSLHLHHNLISSLEAMSLMNLPLMNLLNLAHNRIAEINRQAFLNVPNLRYLYLTHNKITNIFPNQFAAFEQLEMLDLTHNLLINVAKDSFSHLPLLRQLYLGNNKIAAVEEDAFTNSSIVILILASNRLKELPEGVFNGLPTLQQLSLKDNQLKTLNQNLFYNTPMLVMLDLSDNELLDLPSGLFISQIKLLLVDLSRNKIVRTPYAAFNRRIGTVLLQENPLVCTEKVHMLQDGAGVFVPTSDDLVCGDKPKTQVLQLPSVIEETTFAPGPKEESPFKLAEDEEPEEAPSLDVRRPAIRPISTIQEEDGERELIPVRPINAPPGATPAAPLRHSLNIRPNSESRSRGLAGPETSFTGKGNLLPNQEDEEIAGMTDALPSSTTSPDRRRVTDIADNPNIIHPFPVPFLKRGPNLSQSFFASTAPGPETTTITHTLPPSIVIASNVVDKPENKKSKEELQGFEEFALQGQPPKEVEAEEPPPTKDTRIATPTAIIVACLSTVAIVMVAVFAGLCVARHRHVRRFGSACSDSTAARTNAYVAAQAAQLNMIYGTVNRSRRASSLTQEDPNAWMFAAPGNYNSYYK